VRRFRGNAPDAERVTQFVYLMLAGVLTGNEFSGWIGFHPALDRLPPAHRLPAEQAIYRRYGRIMPTLMTATLAAAGSILARTGRRSPAYRSTLASAACYAAMLVVTLTRNVPINQQLLALPDIPESYPEFARLRSRWDALHTRTQRAEPNGPRIRDRGSTGLGNDHRLPRGWPATRPTWPRRLICR
jgi:hypothetical protein